MEGFQNYRMGEASKSFECMYESFNHYLEGRTYNTCLHAQSSTGDI